MNFSLTQQRTAFLTQACLGTTQASAPARTYINGSQNPNQQGQLVATCDRQGSQQLVVEIDGADPQLINPLLLGFNRASRSVYQQSVRASQEELSWRYGLKLVQYQDEYLLIGVQNDNPAAAKLLIGRGRAASLSGDAFSRCPIELEPGWSWVQQTYNERETAHLYLVQDVSLSALTTSFCSANGVAEEPSPAVSQAA